MPGATATFALPYPVGNDDIRDGDDTIKALADRIELLLSTRSNRNVIRNGDFTINQRGLGPFTATGVYTTDGWRKDHVGGTFTVLNARASGGWNTDPSYYTHYLSCKTAGQSAAGDYSSLAHRIENVRTLHNRNVTLSICGYGDFTAGTKVGIEIVQNFGTGGSPAAMVMTSIGQVFLTGENDSIAKVTFKMPSILGKAIGTNEDSYVQITLWTSAGANFAARASNIGIQNGEPYFYWVQLEDGTQATPFERLPTQQQLAWCQRYYFRAGPTEVVAHVIDATAVAVQLVWPVPMRAAPTLGNSAGTFIWGILYFGGTYNTSGQTPQSATARGGIWVCAQAGMNGTVGRMARLDSGHYLEASAEL